MPLYEYECRKCGERTEIIQRFDDPPLTRCAECGGRVERLISAPAFQFKGSGWYVTDYAGRKTKAAEGDGAGGESKTDAKGGPAAAKQTKEKPAKKAAGDG